MKQIKNREDLVEVHYRGLHPSASLIQFVEGKMWELHDEAPYDSFLDAHFTRFKEKDYKANLRITSPAGSFFASAHGPTLHQVIKALTLQTRRQLNKWKSSRILPRSRRREKTQFLNELVMSQELKGPVLN